MRAEARKPVHGRAAPPRDHSLASLALQSLERQIVGGRIAAGAKLVEAEVAASLGVSRGPVREAFRALAAAGLVRVEKNRGVFVREVSLEEADELFELRAALEGQIGRLAARRIAGDEVSALRALAQRMPQPAARGRRAEQYTLLNVEFHDRLAQAARNRALLAAYRGLVAQLGLYRRATVDRGTAHLPQTAAEHAAIVDAVAARDERRAEALLVAHVEASRERLHAALAPAPPKVPA